jgi:hypothetical protein
MTISMLSTLVLKRIISLVCISSACISIACLSIVPKQGERPLTVSEHAGAGLTIASTLKLEDGKRIICTIHVTSIRQIEQMRGRSSFPKTLGMISEMLLKKKHVALKVVVFSITYEVPCDLASPFNTFSGTLEADSIQGCLSLYVH